MLVRCAKHAPKKETYANGGCAEPIGYPETAAICGRVACAESGMVWLNAREWSEYLAGCAVFGEGVTNALNVKVRPSERRRTC